MDDSNDCTEPEHPTLQTLIADRLLLSVSIASLPRRAHYSLPEPIITQQPEVQCKFKLDYCQSDTRLGRPKLISISCFTMEASNITLLAAIPAPAPCFDCD